MTAEGIARAISDIRAGRVDRLPDVSSETFDQALHAIARVATGDRTVDEVVIDASAVYEDLTSAGKPIDVYEDHVFVPPSRQFTVAYENEHGNVVCMLAATMDLLKDDPTTIPAWLADAVRTGENPPGWRDQHDVEFPEEFNGDHDIDWKALRWCCPVFCFAGGRKEGHAVRVQGPSCMWIMLATGEGKLEDVHWIMLTRALPLEAFQTPSLVLLGAVNLLACTNITAEVPPRARAESRRLARIGVTVKVLTVKPHRTARRGVSASISDTQQRLTSVRGHFAHYGACCPTHEPRGLLFGKLTGRYYVPQHARGSAEQGEIVKTYELDTDERLSS